MSADAIGSHDVVSFYSVGTALLRSRKRIGRWMFVGLIAGAVWGFTRPLVYKASASFVSQSGDTPRAGLAALAGQFGVSLPTDNQSVSPDFYARLLTSRDLLDRIARDTFFVVPELGSKPVSFIDLFEIKGASQRARYDEAVEFLGGKVAVSVSKPTGIIDVSLSTRWPTVSLAIVSQLISGVNDFNLHTRQGQASTERRFVEGRLALAADTLRAAENRMENFLAGNRQIVNSPELTFQRDRLQRDLSLQQQVYTTLAQSYEDLRMREVRDTPLITLVEAPAVPAQPEPRGRIKLLLLGLILGAFVGSFLVLVRTRFAGQGPADGLSAADEFDDEVSAFRHQLLGRTPWARRSAVRA